MLSDLGGAPRLETGHDVCHGPWDDPESPAADKNLNHIYGFPWSSSSIVRGLQIRMLNSQNTPKIKN